MFNPAPSHVANLTHKDSGRIVTARVTWDLVEPVAGFDASFTWRDHHVDVEAALMAGDHSVFMRWPEKTDRPA